MVKKKKFNVPNGHLSRSRSLPFFVVRTVINIRPTFGFNCPFKGCTYAFVLPLVDFSTCHVFVHVLFKDKYFVKEIG